LWLYIYYWSFPLKFMAQKSLSLQEKSCSLSFVQQDPNFWFVCEGETLCAKNGEGILVGDELFSEKCCRSPRGRLLYRSIGWRRVVVAVVPWPSVRSWWRRPSQDGRGRHHKPQSLTLYKLFPKRERQSIIQ